MARDVFALLDHAGVERAHLLGFSMGAHIALVAAMTEGGRIDHLVVAGVGGRIFEPPRDPDGMAKAMEAASPADIADPMLKSFRHFADEQKEDRLALAACSRAPASRDHQGHAVRGPPTHPRDRRRARRAGRAAAGPGCGNRRRQGGDAAGLRSLLDDRARPVQGECVRLLRRLAGIDGQGSVQANPASAPPDARAGPKVLASLMPGKPNNKALAKLGDDRVLSEMAARVFSAGFVWDVIDKKWPGFEEAFLEFNPKRLLFQPAEFWEKLASDKRIVRNPQKIRSVRENAKFVSDIAGEHGSFGKFLADWPADDQVGLMEVLGKRGSRLGGFSGQYLLRFLGWDAFVLSGDVLLCLRDSGVPIGARHLEEGPARGAGAVQRLGQGKRAADHPHLAHLRAVDRRELRRGAAEKGHAAMTDILLINPNTTQSITDLVLRTARRFAAKGTRLRAVVRRFRAALHRLARGLCHRRPRRGRRAGQRPRPKGRRRAGLLRRSGIGGAQGDRPGAGGRHGRCLDPSSLRAGRALLHRHRRRALEGDAASVRRGPRARRAARLGAYRGADRRRHRAQSEGRDGACSPRAARLA